MSIKELSLRRWLLLPTMVSSGLGLLLICAGFFYSDVHTFRKRKVDDLRTVASVLTGEQEQRMAWVRHPIVRAHPITGRKALYAVSGSSFGIEGLPEHEARGLLDELRDHATQPEYQVRLKYGVGDIVVWDNASLLHSATLIDPNDARTLWRITIKEERRPS